MTIQCQYSDFGATRCYGDRIELGTEGGWWMVDILPSRQFIDRNCLLLEREESRPVNGRSLP